MPVITPACQTIPLNAIIFNNGWSLHPWDSLAISEALLQSFHRIGILHRPILLAQEGDFFDVLCGFKRLSFAKLFAQTERMECLVFSQDTDPTILLETLLTDQCLSQPLSLVEKARFIEICTRFLSHRDIVSMYLEKLQLRKDVSALTELKVILQQDPLVITEIHAGRLQERIVSELLRLPDNSDRTALVQLFKDLAMGNSKQKRFMTLICDLAYRNSSAISTYLKIPAIADILNDPVINIPQKIQHLGTYLQHELCPAYSQAEENFRQQVRTWQLPSVCSISHSPGFEKDDVTLSITFRNIAECARLIAKINNILESNS